MIWLFYGLVSTTAGIGLFNIWEKRQRRKRANRIITARIHTGIALQTRLQNCYKEKYKELTAAVISELFYEKTLRCSPIRSFLDDNETLVMEELTKLKDDKEVLEAVHVMLSTQIQRCKSEGLDAEPAEKTIKKLEKLGLLVTIESMSTSEVIRSHPKTLRRRITIQPS